ncbi:MAG: cobyric acid synthase, partial [Candidatus Omnitrophica bacterium]|nr:cobyric acid synthase [Candidatus Omnitrophota bacterium]
RYKNKMFRKVKDSFDRLSRVYDVIVIEGAGSPAEINLKAHDIVNLRMARLADAPVILVGDIDKGGVFASFVGTLELLEPEERKMIKGFIINKFRGDKRLLKGGVRFLEERTRKPVLGVIPYFKGIRIPEEDSVPLEKRRKPDNREDIFRTIDVAIIKLPHISNFTDFDALESEPDVRLSYVDDEKNLGSPDVIIIPGTKNTLDDLVWLKRTGIAERILSTVNSQLSTMLIGICGGYQMLGKVIYDSHGIESSRKKVEGLGILPITTSLALDKILSQVKAKELATGLEVYGYEIHHGRATYLSHCERVFEIIGTKRLDGTMIQDGRIWGTYIHSVFDSYIYRRDLLNRLRKKKGLEGLFFDEVGFNVDGEIEKLASLVRENIDIPLLYEILNDGL